LNIKKLIDKQLKEFKYVKQKINKPTAQNNTASAKNQKTNFKKAKLDPKKLYKFSKKILNSKFPHALPYKTKISIIQKKNYNNKIPKNRQQTSLSRFNTARQRASAHNQNLKLKKRTSNFTYKVTLKNYAFRKTKAYKAKRFKHSIRNKRHNKKIYKAGSRVI